MTVEEVVGLMVQAGMFDDAVQLARKFSVPLASIFEALAARLDKYICVCNSQ